MTGRNLVRRAGAGWTVAGDRAWWSVADGQRGRRWREAIVSPGGLRHSLLLETSPAGTFLHLELATPAGLLTLHPEGDGTLHGNVLTQDGLRHVVALPWAPDGLVHLEGSPVARAAMARLLEVDGDRAADAGRVVLRIGGALDLDVGPVPLHASDAGSWELDGIEVAAAPDGLPILDQATSWPLDLPVTGKGSGPEPSA